MGALCQGWLALRQVPEHEILCKKGRRSTAAQNHPTKKQQKAAGRGQQHHLHCLEGKPTPALHQQICSAPDLLAWGTNRWSTQRDISDCTLLLQKHSKSLRASQNASPAAQLCYRQTCTPGILREEISDVKTVPKAFMQIQQDIIHQLQPETTVKVAFPIGWAELILGWVSKAGKHLRGASPFPYSLIGWWFPPQGSHQLTGQLGSPLEASPASPLPTRLVTLSYGGYWMTPTQFLLDKSPLAAAQLLVLS